MGAASRCLPSAGAQYASGGTPQPCKGDCEAGGMIQLGAVIGCGSTAWPSRHGTGSTAWPSRHGTGSTAWVRRLAGNPSVGVRRQLPLHKGGPVAGRPYCLWSGGRTAILSLLFCVHPAQRGSAVWVQRHAGPVAGRPYCLCLGSLCLPGKREYDSPGIGLARRGSAVWPSRHGTLGSPADQFQ